ncbi:MAG: hypothetical protein WA705_29380 [Candidatus Ozemobacteraceae bacterium]
MIKMCFFVQNIKRGGYLPATSFLAFMLLCSMVAAESEKSNPAGHAAHTVQSAGKKPAPKRVHIRFGDIYVAGMAVLLPGGGTLEPPGSVAKVSAKTLRREILIPSGSLITTGASETARARLGEHSLLRISPDSAVRIYSLHLKLERGEICIQQGKTVLPLRILASTTAMVVERESAADFFLSKNGSLIVTVQAGTTTLQSSKQSFSAGQRIEVSNDKPLTAPPVSHLLDWSNSPRFVSWQDMINSLGVKMSDDTFTPAVSTGGEPVLSDSERQPVESAPVPDSTPPSDSERQPVEPAPGTDSTPPSDSERQPVESTPATNSTPHDSPRQTTDELLPQNDVDGANLP